MAGGLPKQPNELARIPGARLAILASMWHADCVDPMVQRARSELISLGVAENDISVHRLPGSLELPLAAQLLFQHDPLLNGILAFGVVLKGGTTHDESVLQRVIQGFGSVSERFGKPIINEVIGVRDLEDARQRAGDDERNKGLEAAFAISEFLAWRRVLDEK